MKRQIIDTILLNNFYTLSLIIQLKKMNFSLNEIKEYINVKEVGYLEDLLNKQQCRIEEQITNCIILKKAINWS